jgi:hypothetical protein
MYGLWNNNLNKWMIDGYDHKKNVEIPCLFKTKKEALAEAEIMNRDWTKRGGKMIMKKTDDIKVKMFRKIRKPK